jgi:hypothetical protein
MVNKMLKEYKLSIRDKDKEMISKILEGIIEDIWLIRPRIHRESRFDRRGFVQAEAILMQGVSDICFLPDPRAMPSPDQYDEILIGVAHEDPNGGMPRVLFARSGNNEGPASEIKTLESERYAASIVRERSPLTRGINQNNPPEYFHIYDLGVLLRGENGSDILIITHESETWTVEISLDSESINRELADRTLVPL